MKLPEERGEGNAKEAELSSGSVTHSLVIGTSAVVAKQSTTLNGYRELLATAAELQDGEARGGNRGAAAHPMVCDAEGQRRWRLVRR